MEAYKFETIILENGMIKVPELEKYKSMKVEVFVVLKPTETKKKDESISEFLEKWGGFFNEVSTTDIRYNAIMDKHK